MNYIKLYANYQSLLPSKEWQGLSQSISPSLIVILKDKLTELQTLQEECQSIFKGLYKEETTASKASLVLNWLGHLGSMTLKSLDVDKGS